MPECRKCGVRIRSGTLCQIHAVEQRAAGVDHDHEPQRVCVGCEEHAPEGSYSTERRGMWFCPGCQPLALRRDEHRQVAAETPDALNGAVRWAVGDRDAYPDEDPAAMDAGFETASTRRAMADGGPDLQEWARDLIHEQVADEAEEPQDASLWTSKGRLKAEASKVDFVERDDVADLVSALEARGEIVYWHGQIAPTGADHISEIIASEVKAEFPRSTLIGRLNSAKQSAEDDTAEKVVA